MTELELLLVLGELVELAVVEVEVEVGGGVEVEVTEGLLEDVAVVGVAEVVGVADVLGVVLTVVLVRTGLDEG